jgi:hypothetical protein
MSSICDVTRQTVYLRSMCRVRYAVFSISQLVAQAYHYAWTTLNEGRKLLQNITLTTNQHADISQNIAIFCSFLSSIPYSCNNDDQV